MKQKAVVPADDSWKDIDAREFPGAAAKRIGEEWMLITAGNTASDPGNWNTMTASWGGLGVLWGKNVAFMFIRPTRYTFGFANENPLFTLSFFDPSRRGALELAGSRSGRDTDKAEKAGITPIVFPPGNGGGAVGFREATEIIICRKLYTHDFDAGQFLDPEIDTGIYAARDYHRMFIGEILAIKAKK